MHRPFALVVWLTRFAIVCRGFPSEVSSCKEFPCKAGGRCIENKSSGRFVCECPFPFYGYRCESWQIASLHPPDKQLQAPAAIHTERIQINISLESVLVLAAGTVLMLLLAAFLICILCFIRDSQRPKDSVFKCSDQEVMHQTLSIDPPPYSRYEESTRRMFKIPVDRVLEVPQGCSTVKSHLFTPLGIDSIVKG